MGPLCTYVTAITQKTDFKWLTEAELCKIITVTLSNTGNNEEDIAWLLEALALLPTTIEILELSNNGLKAKHAPMIAKIIGKYTQLKRFSLADNNLDSEGISIILGALPNKIEQLAIRAIKLDNKALDKLCKSLESWQFLNHLDLADIEIDDDGVKILALGLKNTTCLTELFINKVNFNSNTGILIAEALKHKPFKSLKVLDLSGNSLGDEGVKPFADALTDNSLLTGLNLSNNNLTDNSATSLTEALDTMSGLIHVSLNTNQFSAVGLSKIIGIIDTAHCIIDIDNNNTNQASKELLRTLVEERKAAVSITLPR